MRSAAFIVLVAACGSRSAPPPPPPTVVGTLLCEPQQPELLGAGAADVDEIGQIESLEREVVAGVTSDAFLRRVVAAEHFDAAAIAHVTARPVKDSRLVEIGVSLPDRALAARVCDAVLAHYIDERELGGRDPLAPVRRDVRVLDGCAPPPPQRATTTL